MSFHTDLDLRVFFLRLTYHARLLHLQPCEKTDDGKTIRYGSFKGKEGFFQSLGRLNVVFSADPISLS